MRYSLREISANAMPYDWPSWLYCRIGSLLLWLAQPLRLSPNAVSYLGPLAGGLAAVSLFLWGEKAALGGKILFIVFAALAYMADEMDGIWARTTGRMSRFGGWLDWKCGEAKDWLLNMGMILYWGRELLLQWTPGEKPFFTFELAGLFPLLALLVLVFVSGKGIFLSLRWFPEREARDYTKKGFTLPVVCLVADAFKVGVVYSLAVFFFPVFAGWLILYTGMYWVGIFVHLGKQKRAQQQDGE